MTTIFRISAAISAGAIAAALSSSALGQADNTNSLIAPAPIPSYAQPDPYYVSRQAYMEEAGRRWDAMVGNGRALTPYQADRVYGTPYVINRRGVWTDSQYRSRHYLGGPGVAAGRPDPDEYASGIWNPKS